MHQTTRIVSINEKKKKEKKNLTHTHLIQNRNIAMIISQTVSGQNVSGQNATVAFETRLIVKDVVANFPSPPPGAFNVPAEEVHL